MTNDADLKPAVLVLAALPEFLMGPLRILGRCHDFYREDESGRDSMIAEIGPKIRAIVMAGGSVAPISLLEKLPSLEIITVFGVGYDGVPIDWCRSHNIRVTNTPDVLTDDVADTAVSLVLMTDGDGRDNVHDRRPQGRTGRLDSGITPRAHRRCLASPWRAGH